MKLEALKDGTTVTLREATMNDVEDSLRFFLALPPDDRRYLRVDVTKKEIVERRLKDIGTGRLVRIVGVVDDKIVADGSLEISSDTWHQHVGEIRVIVAREFQRRRLGALLIAELFRLAQERGVEKVVAKMAAPQTAARKIFERIGFRVDSVLPDYIRDADGNLQSLVIMSRALDEISREMAEFYKNDDWPDG